jgi:putative ABC transport system permease protein
MSVLGRKLIRDIASGKARFAAVAFLVFLGLSLFLATWLGYRSLDHSYKSASEHLKYNDFIIKVAGAPDGAADGLLGQDGIVAVSPRLVLESGCFMPGGQTIICQLVGMPAASRPEVNDVLVEKGSYFKNGAGDQCLVETHLADYYKVDPGQEVEVVTPVGNEKLTVSGTASSAEFFLVSSPRSIIASPQNYGVLFVPQDWLQRSFAREGISNEFCFRVAPGADAGKAMAGAEGALAQYNVLYASLGDETEARQLLNLDVQGFKQISIFFPVMFLAVAALSLYMILTRIIHIQRSQIGVMRAFGVSRRQLTAHYLSYALLVGSVGAVTGLVAGYFLADWLTHMYSQSLGIPLVTTVMDWEAVLAGFLLALIVCCLAAALPVRHLIGLPPALVMNESGSEGKSGVVRRSLLERVLPPVRAMGSGFKIPMRNLSRNRRRALLNILGIALAFMLVLVSLALLDSMDAAFAFYFDDFVRYDADVYFAAPQTVQQAGDVQAIAPVKEAAPYIIAQSRFTSNGRMLGEGALQALPANTELLGFYGTDGKALRLPVSGALLSDWFRDGLGLKEGDYVTIDTSLGSLRMKVKGFVKQIGGLTVFADLSSVQTASGSSTVNGLLVKSTGPQGTELRDALLQIPGAAGVEIPEFTRETMRSELVGVMFVFAGMMILFAAAMALALIYNTISIAYLERETELSVMRALGTSLGRVSEMFTVENILVALIAIVPGVLLGYALSVFMMKTFSTEFFSAPAVIRPVSYLITIAGILLLVLMAELPSLRRARHVDLASMIRERVR